MICSRRLYKGNSYEICLPLTDSGVTLARFYTAGDVIIEKVPEITGDSMCFSFTEEEIASLPDGVLRYELVTEYETTDTNSPYVVVTPGDYSGTTLEDMLAEAFDSGLTSCSGSSCDLQNRGVSLRDFPFEYSNGSYIMSGNTFTITPSKARYDGMSQVRIYGSFLPTEAWSDGASYQRSLLSAITLTDNGTYTSYDGFSSVTVNVAQQTGHTDQEMRDSWNSGYTSGYTDGRGETKDINFGDPIYMDGGVASGGGDVYMDIIATECTLDTSRFEYGIGGFVFTVDPEIVIGEWNNPQILLHIPANPTNTDRGGYIDCRFYDTDGNHYDRKTFSFTQDAGSGYSCEGVYESGYTSGYTDGYNSGATGNPGYDEGFEVGFDEGYQSGYTDGSADGYDSGYTSGYTDGSSDGFDSGYTSGHTDGYESGYTDGYESGSTDGFDTGYDSGYTDGHASGVTEGFDTGYNSGFTDGVNSVHCTGYTQQDLDNAFASGFSAGYVSGMTDCSGVPIDYSSMPLTFEIISGGTVVYTMTPQVWSSALTIEYSSDNGNTWSSITPTTEIAVSAGDKLMFRGDNAHYGAGTVGAYGMFSAGTAMFKAYGNILSMIYSHNFETATTAEYVSTFTCFFMNCTGLVDASNLVLMSYDAPDKCYMHMFSGCISLVAAPKLPAEIVYNECYSHMFDGCTSLTDAPDLPATSLTYYCYADMFAGCTSLTGVPKIDAIDLSSATGCCKEMFMDCTSITEAPELKVSILIENCYRSMFKGCTSLSSVTCLATDVSGEWCLYNWLDGVSATGTFVKHPNMSSWPSGHNGIPTGWTVVDADIS